MDNGNMGDGTTGALQNLNNTQQSGVRVLGLLVQAIKTIFPQQTGTSTTATAGAGTLPAKPVGFIVVSLPDGTSVKVPYYAS